MATAALATAFVNIVPGTKEFETDLRRQLGDSMPAAGDAASQSFGAGFKKNFGGLAAAIGATVAAAAIGSFAMESVTAASDLNESLNAVKVSFGDASAAINALGEDSANKLGLSQVKFNEIATRFSSFATTIAGPGGDIAKTVGDISQRGTDFASVFNMDVDQALGAFQSGLAGQMEPLRAYGIDLSEANVKAYALANGIWAGEGAMTEAQKVQARYGSLMQQTDKVAGDFANTQDGMANSQRILKANWEDITASLGQMLIPAMEGLLAITKPVVSWMKENPALTQLIVIALGSMAAALAALTIVAWGMNSALWANTAALLANPITWIVLAVVAAVGLLIAAIVAIVQNWDAIVAWMNDVFGPVIEWIGSLFTWLYENVIKPVGDGIMAAIEAIGAMFTWLWETIFKPIVQAFVIAFLLIGMAITWLYENGVKPAVEGMAQFFTWLYEEKIKPIFDGIAAVFTWIWNYIIQPVINYIVEAIKGWGRIFTWLYENIIKPVFEAVGTAFSWIWEHVVKPTANWIVDAVKNIGKVIGDIFGGIGKTIGDAFGAIAGIVKGPINGVIDLLNGMIEALNSIKIDIPEFARGLFNGASSIKFNIGKIPKLAKGGYVDQPTTALIGEAGPEVVTPLKDFERMMGLSADNSNGATLNYYAAPNVSIDSEQALFTAMRRAKVVTGW